DEGRLSLGEYDDRLKDTYSARTYGDLDQILKDLPGFHAVADSELTPAEPMSPPPAALQGGQKTRSNPQWLIGIWSAWLVAVSVNIVIWALVSISNGEAVYFWPMWVAGPWGAVLLASTLSTRAMNNSQNNSQNNSHEQKRYRDS